MRHGALFFDGHGRFGNLRESFSRYPDDVMLIRMRESAWRINHYGEYNFCKKLVARGDPIPMQVALGHFTEAVMRMYFYLDGDFAPYWKWLGLEFRKRAFSPTTVKTLEALHRAEPAQQAEAKGLGFQIMAFVTNRFLAAGYTKIQLHTEYYRLAAIKTYLKVGYIPVVNDDSVKSMWKNACRSLAWDFPPGV